MQSAVEAANSFLTNVGDVLIYALICFIAVNVKGLVSSISTAVQTKTQCIENESERELITKAIKRVEELAETAVSAIEGLKAKDLRKLVMSGEESRENLCALSKEALNKIKSWLEPEAMKLLYEKMDDVDDYIKNVIEAQLEKLKKRYE